MKNKKEIIRKKMIESAAREFSLYGYERANINKISMNAGFGKGTIYNYFKNKEELLIEVIRYASHLFIEVIKHKINNENDNLEKIYLIIYGHFEFYNENENLLKVLIQEGYSAPYKIQEKILSAMDECYKLIIEIIKDGKKEKIFLEKTDEFLATNILTGMLFHHDCTCMALKGKIDPEYEAKIIFDFFLNGVCNKARAQIV